VNTELERCKRKAAVVGHFEVLYWKLPEGLRETAKTVNQDGWSPDRDLQNMKQNYCPSATTFDAEVKNAQSCIYPS
jgi:hypothetical protein